MRLILTVSLVLFITGCASYFKRKECEGTNWFKHGQDVALQGKNLEEDDFISECRKVEAEISDQQLDLGFKKGRANYCTPETSFQTGKSGTPFQPSMCEGENIRLLTARYKAGILEYCDYDNGFSAGASGNKYKNVCPKNMEVRFLSEYKKGRRQFLDGVIQTKEDQMRGIDDEVRDLERTRQSLNYQLVSLNSRVAVVRRRTYDGVTGSRADTMSVGATDEDKIQRDNLENQIRNVDYQIRSKRQEQTGIRKEIGSLRTEMATL